MSRDKSTLIVMIVDDSDDHDSDDNKLFPEILDFLLDFLRLHELPTEKNLPKVE